MKRIVVFVYLIFYLQSMAHSQSGTTPEGDGYSYITEPDGLSIQPISASDNYFHSGFPYCFEWQYVHEEYDVNSYYLTQVIHGTSSSYTIWTVSLGELIDEITSSPTFFPSSSTIAVPQTMTEVTLKLHSQGISPNERRLEVYRDHLERDRQFNGFTCGAPKIQEFWWDFHRYGKEWLCKTMFNCFGSVWHAYDGSHAHSLDVPPFTVEWEKDNPTSSDWNELSNLAERGDFISYWGYVNGTIRMQHAATFIDSSTTYGANNLPYYSRVHLDDGYGHEVTFNGTGWTWCEQAPEDYYQFLNSTYEAKTGVPNIIFRVKLHKRPVS